jgi:hypothetical protein
MDLVAAAADPNITLRLFLTGTGSEGRIEHGRLPNDTYARRISLPDLLHALDGYQEPAEDRRLRTICYVCGPQHMTDTFVDYLSRQPGMAPERVLCEKWW